MRHVVHGLVVSIFFLVHAFVCSANPLITDDTGTHGQGKFEVEFTGQYDSDKKTVKGVSIESTGVQAATNFTYGLVETVDLALGVPYRWAKGKENGATVSDKNGIDDMTFDLKWRFFEKDGLSLALKPGLKFATGNDAKGIGAGRTGYQVYMIGSLEAAPWGFDANLAYIGNENKVNEERDIWHASFSATREIVKNWKVVGDIGIERNRDKAADKHPAFLIGGFIYSPSGDIDIGVGVKYGLTEAENDWSLLVGTSFQF